jgi:transposase
MEQIMTSLCSRVAGIDVHKKILAVVVVDSADTNRDVASGKFGTTREGLNEMRTFLAVHGATHVAMESTAEYWRPVWMTLEGQVELVLTQARAVQAPRGRKRDMEDARRIARRLLAGDLKMSYVPGPEQRDWRLLSRTRIALIESVVRLRNQIETILEHAQIKLTSVVSDGLGLSGRRILRALIDGVDDPALLAGLGHKRLQTNKQTLADALSGRMTDVQRLVLRIQLDEIEQIECHMEELEQTLAKAQVTCQDAVVRLCEIPGISATAAQQIIAEIGPEAKTFDSAAQLASWVGVSPGRQESAGISTSNRSPKGNRVLRRLLSQAAWAAIARKGSETQRRYRKWVIRMGAQKAAWAVAHYLLRVIWKILHDKIRYTAPDTATLDRTSLISKIQRTAAHLRKFGYTVTISPPNDEAAVKPA